MIANASAPAVRSMETSCAVSPSYATQGKSHIVQAESSDNTNNKKGKEKKSDESDSSNKGIFHGRIGRLRLKTYLLLLASVLILSILIIVHLLTFKTFLYETGPWNYDGSGYLSQHIALDIDLLLTGMAGVVGTTSIKNFIDPQVMDLSGYDEFFPMLQATSESRFMEYLTIVKSDGTIAVNINKNRTGEYWDPAGVVSYVLGHYHAGIQYLVHAPLTQDEYNAEEPQQFFVGGYSRSSGQDMKISGRNGLVRWCATPILSTNSSVQSPIGVLVAGYIMSGKTDILEDAFAVSGNGIAAIKIVDSTKRSVNSVVELLVSTDQSVYYSIGLSDSMQLSMASSDADFAITGLDGKSYRVRSSKLGNVSDGTVAVLIRGYPTAYVDTIFFESVIATLALIAGAFIFDILSTVIGVNLFIDPLQRLMIYVKLKHYELMDDVISKLQLLKRFVLRLVIFGAISMAFLAAMLANNSNTLKAAYSNQLAVRNEIKANALSFAQKQVQMSFGIITRVETLQFKNFVMNSSNGDYSAIQSILNSSATRRKIETNLIVNSSCYIIASAYKNRSGEYFSPEGFCEDIINNPRRVCMLTTITAGQLAATGSPRYLYVLSVVPVVFSLTLSPIA
eukprot:TRINITY_DN306_c0_g1_i3.p1 TRINITY_DN306_c0_g1~~TRINITY_DN306_c0_g1_i3.p1  ORF type:complete len:621 (+),score=153.39 TRINITY_DN306_c0_g1_i3:35-1897(+)